MKQISIAVSRLAPNYEAWLKKLCPGLEILNFDGRDPGDFRSRVREYSGLQITAFSEDGIAEAAELSDHDSRFCVAVQWHPERMDIEIPMSGGLGKMFIENVNRENAEHRRCVSLTA